MTALLFMIGTATVAQAAHPLVTDDSGTQREKNHQVEFNTDRIRQNNASARVGALTYSYGIRNNLDVFFNTPWTWSAPSGVNDASLGAKWRFSESAANSTALKIALLLPTGAENDALGNGKAGAVLTLIQSDTAEPWAFHANASLTLNRYALPGDRDTSRKQVWSLSAAAVYAIASAWKIVADTGISQDTERRENRLPAYVLTGVVYSLTDAIDLDAGIRFGARCASCASQIARQFGVGVTARF